jgi:hypothetical protein
MMSFFRQAIQSRYYKHANHTKKTNFKRKYDNESTNKNPPKGKFYKVDIRRLKCVIREMKNLLQGLNSRFKMVEELMDFKIY